MSNNEPDYEDNLAFPPQEIKSQDELTQNSRQSEVLIKALEKCEKLERQLKIAKKYLEFIYTDTKNGHFPCDACGYELYCEGCINQEWAKDALEQIKELDK